jgi:hypothetical protein
MLRKWRRISAASVKITSNSIKLPWDILPSKYVGIAKPKNEKYSLLIKTECRRGYLLTERKRFFHSKTYMDLLIKKHKNLQPSSKVQTSSLTHLFKPNPHRQKYSNMILYLRCKVLKRSPTRNGNPKKHSTQSLKDAKKRKSQKKIKEVLAEAV